MPSLLVENGPEKGRRVELKAGGRAVLGRDKTCEISVADHLCSRRHFEVVEQGTQWVVRDLGSSNGTFVNDERVEGERALKDADSVQAGEVRLVFQGDAEKTGADKSKGLVGRMVGGYRILDRLGRGAMGTVYKANQTSLNRVVALKILSPKVAADPAFVKRFQSEAQAAGRLNHPNVVQVYDVGQDQGLHFYSMEFIANGTVEDLLRKQGRLDPDLALSVVLDAARGLVFAEKKGLVHRDIKPANLMINEEGVVKIADLGLAHDMGAGGRGDEPIFGTPHFISPEQALGRPIDARSDLYSLGATAYFLLSGQTPFDGENVQEIVRKQIEEDPPALRERRPDCPAALAEVVEKLMRKDPADRFPTAQGLVDVLERLESGGGAAGGGKKGLVAAAALVVLLGGGFAAWKVFGGGTPAAPPPVPAGRSANEEEAQRRLAEAQRETERVKRDADAKSALSDARLLHAEAEAKGAGADWSAVLAKYEDVAARFGETDSAEPARKAAEELKRRLEEELERKAAESRAAESRAVAARAAADGVRAAVEPLVKARSYGEALTALSDLKRRHAAEPEASAEIQRLQLLAVASCKEAATAALADARAKEAAGQADEAAKALDDAAKQFLGPNASPATAAIDDAVKGLAAAAGDVRRRAEERRRADRAADAVAVFEARRAAGELLQRSSDLDGAERLLAEAEPRLRSDFGRAALRPDVAGVAAALRVRAAWLAAMRALPKDAKLKLPSPSDRKRMQEYAFVAADDKGVTVKRGTAEVRFDLAALPLSDAYESLFKDHVEKSDALRRDVVELLLLAGRADRAVELAATLPEGPDRVATLARAERERDGWTLLAEVRDLTTKTAADESMAGKLLRAVTRLLEEFADTRACLLNRRDPPAAP
jgi:pSer/pThr/pTyr-binding forkhead associated (FHA) protein